MDWVCSTMEIAKDAAGKIAAHGEEHTIVIMEVDSPEVEAEMKCKIQLIVRPFQYTFSVGYWDGYTGNPSYDFRSLGIRNTEKEANDLLRNMLLKYPHRYRQ